MKKKTLFFITLVFLFMASNLTVMADVAGKHPVKSETIEQPTDENDIQQGDDSEEHTIQKGIQKEETEEIQKTPELNDK